MKKQAALLSVPPLLWLLGFFSALAWSAITTDHFTWFLETVPAFIGLAILAVTRRSFPLTPMLYILILIHCIILMVGGKYTYAEVPAGFWVRDWLGLARNPYDRLGHFAQGLVPAILAREILLRKGVVKGRGWLFYLVVSICLAFSAFYELVEWRTAVAEGQKADAFLGTQGDVWDTQWDMATALIGSIVGQLALGRWHEKQIVARFGKLKV